MILVAAALASAGCYLLTATYRLNDQGNDAMHDHDYRLARERYQELLAEALKDGDKSYASVALYSLGRANGYLCNFADAERYFEDSIAMREHLPDSREAYLTQNLMEFARLYMAQGKWEEAVAQFKRAYPRLEYMGAENADPIGYADALEDYERSLRNAGKPEDAEKVAQRIAELRSKYPSAKAKFKVQPYPSHCDSA